MISASSRNPSLLFGEARFHLTFIYTLTWAICLWPGGGNASGRAEGATMQVEAVSALVQVFPTKAPRGETTARIEAARGEWEAFQLVVQDRPGRRGLRGVRATVGPLRAADGGATLPAPRLYRVGYVDIKTPSSVEGGTGLWPDPLIPDVDAYVGEQRNAFPFDVPDGEARAIWVSVFVPDTAPPGAYRGAVTVSAEHVSATDVPIELTVHRFALPRSSSIPVTFGIAASAVAKGHHLSAPDDALERRYGVAALRHRLSLHGGTMNPPPFKQRPDGEVIVDFEPYDAEVGPFLDGTADKGGPAEGARFTAIDLRVPMRLLGPARERFTRAMVEHFKSHGWIDRLFAYAFDEPRDDRVGDVRSVTERLRVTAPGVPRLVTKELVPELVGSVDIWCPIINHIEDKPGGKKSPPRSSYDERLRAGEKLWWYQSCMSHGCDIVGGAYFTGWPSYVVDAPAVAQRIFEWLTFRYRMGGELYYQTVEAYAQGLDPWRDAHVHGGNGDGTLFYPGRPDTIGGKTDIPVESIRLERIRDGLEDYEYLRLHAERYGREATDAIVGSIARKTYDWDHDGARLYEARHRLATELDAVPPRPAR
jgi:hypothetical protein